MSDNALDETKTGHHLMFASYIGATGGPRVSLSELGVSACILSGVRITPCVFSKLGIPVLHLSERSAEEITRRKQPPELASFRHILGPGVVIPLGGLVCAPEGDQR